MLKSLAGLMLTLFFAAQANAVEEGKTAPALKATLLDGSLFHLSENAGKVVVLNFWATWCAPCREEMPALDAYYRRHKTEGLQMLAISVDNPADEPKVREVMRAFSFPAAMARDVDARAYGRIWRVPLTFVIDRQGVLRKDGWYGDPKIDQALLDQVVAPLLDAR